MIQLLSVSKVYGEGASRVEALKHVDMTVGSGEFVSIMGPSGSGKSTLLNLLSAIDTPTTGQIKVNDEDISKFDDEQLTLFRRRRVGMVFQSFNLLPTLNAFDNVILPVLIERRTTDDDRARANALLDRVGLGDRKNHRMHELSGGQMQRVAVARSLMMKPEFVLADEPTGNLDSKSGASILELLRSTCDETGTTIIMVTHDPRAAHIADRVLEVLDGRVVADRRSHDAVQSGAAQ